MTRMGGLAVASGLFFLVILALGLLYAYRSQSPAVPTVPYSAVLTEIQNGRVRSVLLDDGRATLTLVDGTTQLATLPDNGEPLARMIDDRNRVDPAHRVELRFGGATPANANPVFVVLLPLLFLAFPLVYFANAAARGRGPQRYEALARLAELRDRGALTEEEFAREKRRLLK